jgi:MarR family transcriptional regulator, lower aerobic nicotinate degradation pathway regulator
MAHESPDPQGEPGRQRDPDLGIVDALVQLSFVVQGTLAKHAATHHLSMIQTRLLGVLRDRQPTMQELAGLLDLDKSSVTGLVDRAAARGLVVRTPSVEDRRAVHVTLTSAGRRIVSAVAQAFESDIDFITARLSGADKKRLSILATKVISQYGASHVTN